MKKPLTANIDPDEIAKFEAQAPRWWDPKGEFKALHDINPLRLDYINSRAPLKGLDVLDIGCGGGILSEAMATLGAHVTGIDMGAAPIAVARFHQKQSAVEIDYRLANAESMAAEYPEKYNVVTCMELLEHVPDPGSIVSACHTLIKPGGHVFFATLNRTIKAYILAIVAAEYILGVVKKGTHTYRKFVRPEEIEHWGSQAGLEKMDLTGLHYNPVLKKQWLGGHADVNYLMHFKKPKN